MRISLKALGFLALTAGLSAQVVNYWQFENSLNDSVGGATLTNNSAGQVVIPSSGRGTYFPNYSSLAADFDEGDYYSGTITPITGSFTIEAFIRRDTSAGAYLDLIAATTNTNLNSFADIGFNFGIRLNNDLGSSVDELVLDVGNGTGGERLQSNFIIPTGKDYYVAVAFDLAGGQATFYVQNLTDGGSVQSSTVGHSLSSIASRSGLFIGGHGGHSVGHVHFDGLIDEVRLSNAVLSQSSLLAIPEPGTYALFAGGAGLLMAALRRARSGRASPARP